MALEIDDLTSQIRSHQEGEALSQYSAGKLLSRIRREKLYKQKQISNFNAYLLTELRDLERAWAYVLLAVAESFEEEHARQYGIKPLNALCKLAREAFKGKKPVELLTGQHRFVDPDGEEHVLDFQQDHSVSTLKALLAEIRVQKVIIAKNDPGPEALPVTEAMQAAALAVPLVRFELRHDREGLTVELQGEPQELTNVLRRITD